MSLVVVTTLIDILGLLAFGVWKLLPFMAFCILAFGDFGFFDGTCVCVYWFVLFFLVMFGIFIQDKVTVFAC